MSDQHTPGPWVDDGYAHIGAVNDQLNGGYLIALCEGPDRAANARRIVACVNACAGIPTESLEQLSQNGSLKVLARNIELEKQRDELLAALEKQFADAKHCQQVMLNEVGIGFLDVVTLDASEEAIARSKGAA